MAEPLVVSNVVFSPASRTDARTGLLGFVRFRLGDGPEIDGVTVRRTLRGKLALSYPRRGRDHFAVRPLDETTRLHIERQVLAGIGLDGGGA